MSTYKELVYAAAVLQAQLRAKKLQLVLMCLNQLKTRTQPIRHWETILLTELKKRIRNQETLDDALQELEEILPITDQMIKEIDKC